MLSYRGHPAGPAHTNPLSLDNTNTALCYHSLGSIRKISIHPTSRAAGDGATTPTDSAEEPYFTIVRFSSAGIVMVAFFRRAARAGAEIRSRLGR